MIGVIRLRRVIGGFKLKIKAFLQQKLGCAAMPVVIIAVLKFLIFVLSSVYIFQVFVSSHSAGVAKNAVSIIVCLGTILIYFNEIKDYFSDYEASKTEQMLWESVGAHPNAETYQVYLDKYPQGKFVDIARIQLARIPPSALTPLKEGWQLVGRYQINGGLAIDIKTDLMWMRCSMGLNWVGETCQGKEATYTTWDQAMRIARQIEYANYDDWRVPTREELESLIYCSGGVGEKDRCGVGRCKEGSIQPTIERVVFPNSSARVFWSSSSADFSSESAWRVNFSVGSDELGNYSDRLQFRLVRNMK